MTLDTPTLRVAFAVVALTSVALFYFVTYRPTRSAYCGWWCLSLSLFLVSASAYLFNGTPHQLWANPLGNVLAVLGAGCVWAGARSLGESTLPRWPLPIAPVVVGTMSALDDPASNIWSGGPYFLAGMWAVLGLAAWELIQLRPGTAHGTQGATFLWALRR